MTAVEPAPTPGRDAPVVWAQPPPRRHPWLAPVAVGVGALLATAYTAVNDPSTSHAFPLCPLKAVTGADCPMCGSLRAVHSLTHGDIVGAADHNIALLVLLPFAAIWYLSWLGRSLGWALPELQVPPRVVLIGVGILVAYGVARNLPIPGHDFLNSTAMLAGRRS